MCRRRMAGVVGLTLLVASVSACGWLGDDAPDDRVAAIDGQGSVSGLPVAFAGGADGWGTVVATSDLVLGIGGDVSTGPDVGVAVDLATGDSWGIGRPPGDGPFSPEVVVALDQTVVMTGSTCPPGTRGSDVEDPCVAPVSYRIDPLTATWTEVTWPAGHRQAYDLFPGPEGSVIGVFRTETPAEVNTVAQLDRDATTWTEIGTTAAAPKRCATSTELFQLDQGPGTAVGPEFTMVAMSLDDGSTRNVGLPPLATGYGGAGVSLACGDDAPVLASSDADTGVSGVFVLTEDGSWAEVADVSPDTHGGTVQAVASGELPIVATLRALRDDVDAALDDPVSAVGVRPDATTAPAGDDIRDAQFIRRGSTGPYILLGPIYEDVQPRVDEPPLRDPVPITLLEPLA